MWWLNWLDGNATGAQWVGGNGRSLVAVNLKDGYGTPMDRYSTK
jgi:hypothetical protein